MVDYGSSNDFNGVTSYLFIGLVFAYNFAKEK